MISLNLENRINLANIEGSNNILLFRSYFWEKNRENCRKKLENLFKYCINHRNYFSSSSGAV